MKITVVLADEQAMFRESIADRLALTPDMAVVAAVGSGEEAIEAAVEHQPKVVVLAVNAPEVASFKAARRLTSLCPNTRLLFLGAFVHDRFIEEALAAGTCGYLTKSEPVARLVEAIRAAASGGSFYSPQIEARLVVDASGVRRVATNRTPRALLSARELEVLQHLAYGASNKEIAANLHIATRTVDRHVQRIMDKLDLHGRVNLARLAIREGLAEA